MVDQRPDILSVISDYVPLRKSGREYSGLCVFHPEKTPSFYVNEDKGTFFCHGCHEGGDVITFIQKIEGLDFKGAIAHLGLDDQPRQTSAEITQRRIQESARRNLMVWVLDMAERVGSLIRESDQREYMATKVLNELDSADEKFLQNEIERTSREKIILGVLEGDLLDPNRVVDLWREKELIEQFVGTNRTYTNEEIQNVYPSITGEYKQRLAGYVRGEA